MVAQYNHIIRAVVLVDTSAEGVHVGLRGSLIRGKYRVTRKQVNQIMFFFSLSSRARSRIDIFQC
jgi:hypothetical protein